MRVFIDTNIFLRFFEYSDDDLEQLRKLSASIRQGFVEVFLTEQVRHEFERRREGVLINAIKEVEKKSVGENFPAPFHSYSEYGQIRDAINAFKLAKNELLQQVKLHAQERALLADQVIAEIFENATPIAMNHECVDRAERRVGLGNPPGKKGEIGDAVNWEHLLEHVEAVPSESYFFIVTSDGDFTSRLAPNEVSRFLAREWRDAKSSVLVVYTNLSKFFSEHFPDISLSREIERLLPVEQLIFSSSFDTTHHAVAVLSQYDDFTDNEVRRLVDAAIINNQIHWISHDVDVWTFFQRLVQGREDALSADQFNNFGAIFGIENDTDVEVPF